MHLDAGAHWDDAYRQGDTTRSWFQGEATVSLRMLDGAHLSGDLSMIDVGGGASTLVDSLLDRDYVDLTVLDVSAIGLDTARCRLGARADRVEWIVADLLTWEPVRHYRVWHDRAVFHFLTHADHREQYFSRLWSATKTGSMVIIGCFAPGGPESCSGLPTMRFDADGLAAQFGNGWRLDQADRQEHVTPGWRNPTVPVGSHASRRTRRRDEAMWCRITHAFLAAGAFRTKRAGWMPIARSGRARAIHARWSALQLVISRRPSA